MWCLADVKTTHITNAVDRKCRLTVLEDLPRTLWAFIGPIFGFILVYGPWQFVWPYHESEPLLRVVQMLINPSINLV